MSFEFNPETFIENATTSDAGSTNILLAPIGEFAATIQGFKIEAGSIQKGERTGQPWVRLDLTLSFTCPEVVEKTKRVPTNMRYGIMMELAEGSTLTNPRIDWSEGKNVKVNRLRAAVGLNVPGEAFNFRMLPGRQVLAKIVQKFKDGDPAQPFNDIDGVVALPMQ